MTTRIWPLPTVEYMPFAEIEEKRAAALIYNNPAYDAVSDRLNIDFAWKAEVTAANTEHWQEIMQGFEGEVVYAVGGGLTVDAAKYIAVEHDLPLVCLPTAISVDAFMTWASGIRRDGCVYYIETKIPEKLIVDLDVIANAPVSVRAAGITDVMSIATGSWDWRYAHDRGKNPPGMEFIPYVYQAAQAILQGVLDAAEAAGRADPDGIKTILDCLAMEVQLCNQVGHARPEEGSEHYFAYAVENVMGKGLPHGDLVGPGILIMAGLQGQDTAPLKKALNACNIPLTNIPEEVIRATLLELPAYCEKHGLAYSLAHDLSEKDLERLPSLA
jgi:glycerol-1-phosphate dehydrogenase [NAD(P)+]